MIGGENLIQKYLESLRTYYWVGHFFFIIASLIALATYFRIDATSYAAAIPWELLLWFVGFVLLLIIQRDLYRIDFRFPRPWPAKGIIYATLATGLVVFLIIVTGGHNSPFHLLALIPVLLCALHYGWQISILAVFLSVTPLLVFDQITGGSLAAAWMGEDIFLLAVIATAGWLVGQVTDLNRHMARDLSGERAFLQLVINNSPSGICVCGDDNRISFTNTSLEKMVGTELQGLSGQEAQKLGQALNVDFIQLLPKVRQGSSIRHYRGKHLQKGSSVRHLELDLVPLPVPTLEGSVLCCIHDITNDVELGRLRLYSNHILELLDLAVIVVDHEDRVTTFNRAAEEVFRLNRQEAQGSRTAELWTRIGLSREDTAQLTNGAVRDIALAFNARHLLIHQAPLKDQHQQHKGHIVIVNDITEQQQMENDLARAATLALVGEMAASMAHEIRNPLAGVRGFTQLLLERRPEEPIGNIQPHLETIVGEIDRVNKLIGDFLMLARPRRLTRQIIKLHTLVQSIVDLARNDANLHGATLETNLAVVPPVDGDSEQLRQVILNLLRNAFAAAGPGGWVRLSTGSAEGKAFLRIMDSGPGIPAELRKKVFDPFFTTKDEGTGLGLAICERIVRQHEGRLELECGAQGTSFTVWLPLTDGVDD